MMLVTNQDMATDTSVATTTPANNATPPRAVKSRARRRICWRVEFGGSTTSPG